MTLNDLTTNKLFVIMHNEELSKIAEEERKQKELE
tara:strand:+ start:349 stop:453 length:105 start_codon:yes stop_codon:yes gene_type:complete